MESAAPESSRRTSDTGTPPGESFRLSSLTFLVVASMIGTGVFTTSGFTLGAVGSVSNVMLCWVLGGVIAICGAVGYGQLASVMPQSGGEYLFLSRHVHPLAGFLGGWISLVAGFSGAVALSAVAFEQYAVPDSLRPARLPADSVAIALIVFFGTVHALHVRRGTWLQDAVVVVKLLALAAFLVIVAFAVPTHDWHITPQQAPPAGVDLVYAVATSLVWISLSFAGFNAAVYVAGESRQAARSVPRALVWGTGLVTVLYLLLNFVFVAATPADDIRWQEPVAAIAARAIAGERLELMIRVVVSLGLATSISGMVMSGPRVYARMADDGVFPRRFRAQNGRFSHSVALQCAISIGLILIQRALITAGYSSSSLLGLLKYLGTTLSLSSACCVLTLFLPSVYQQLPSRNLLKTGMSLLYAVATIASVVLMTISHQENGESRGIWHLTGVSLTVITGLIAWKLIRPQVSKTADRETTHDGATGAS